MANPANTWSHGPRGLIAALSLISAFHFYVPAHAEQAYKARCKSGGDSIIIAGSGERVLEQSLIKFQPTEPDKGQAVLQGICTIRKDPEGHKWIHCWKKGANFFTGNWGHPFEIKPIKVVANSVQYRGWSGACLVKL